MDTNASRIPEFTELVLDEAQGIRVRVSLAMDLARPRVSLAIHDRRAAEGEDDEVITLRIQRDRMRYLGETLIRYAEFLGA